MANYQIEYPCVVLNAVLTCILLSILSCQKDPSPPIQEPPCVSVEVITSTDSSIYLGYKGLQEYGYAKAIKLNKPWEASARAFVDKDGLDLDFKTYNSILDIPLRDEDFIVISEIPLELGCYEMNRELHDDNSTLVSSYLGLDHDIIDDYYYLISEHENYIQIDTLDLVNRRVSGQFMMSFERDNSRIGRPWNPDYVRFFNGTFSCDIIE